MASALDVVKEYITCGRQFASNGNFTEAVDMYAKIVEGNPELSRLLETEYRIILMKCNAVLAEAGKIESIMENLSRAVQLFPECSYFFNESGRYLYAGGYYEQAWNVFQRALMKDAGSVFAERYLNSLKNLFVERWHFRMLNDKIRNESYRAAIKQMIVPNKTRVLDLGTGTGILAMYATESEPLTITACDGSKIMTNLTECILRENQLLLSVVVLNKMSTAMTIKDIERKCSLLVTELFDAGLFGEHILKSLEHAWQTLLTSNASIVPGKAEFFIMGANSETLIAKYQLCDKSKSLLKMKRNCNVHVSNDDETYDCEDIHFYKDMKYMTEAHSVIKIDFTDINDIRDKLYNSKSFEVECKAAKTGQINTYIGWFNLHLTDNITITTDPRNSNRANAWQQAVFYDNIPRNVQKNDTFNLDISLESERLALKPNYSRMTRISPEALRFLNDTVYLSKIKICAGISCIYLAQMTDISQLRIIDLNPFPYFGFVMLQRGIKSLICCAKNEEDKQFFETTFKANGINMSKVNILVGPAGRQKSFGKKKFHVIFINILELCGDIDLKAVDLAYTLKKDHLMSGGLFMPFDVTMMGQIATSKWIDDTNRVYDENVGYSVSKYVNGYQVSQIFHVDYNLLEYTPITEPIEVVDCMDLIPTVHNLNVIQEGNANIALCWYHIELLQSCEVVSTKRPFSFIDGTAFLADPPVPMVVGDDANILGCVDVAYKMHKIIIDKENT